MSASCGYTSNGVFVMPSGGSTSRSLRFMQSGEGASHITLECVFLRGPAMAQPHAHEPSHDTV